MGMGQVMLLVIHSERAKRKTSEAVVITIAIRRPLSTESANFCILPSLSLINMAR